MSALQLKTFCYTIGKRHHCAHNVAHAAEKEKKNRRLYLIIFTFSILLNAEENCSVSDPYGIDLIRIQHFRLNTAPDPGF
jgi:hypothetical protein